MPYQHSVRKHLADICRKNDTIANTCIHSSQEDLEYSLE